MQLGQLPKRTNFYYGWVVLGIGALGMIMTSPGQTYAVSIFLERFIADLGLSRSVVSALYTVGTLCGGLMLPLAGRLIDRHGVRRMMLSVSVLFGLACMYMSTVHNTVMLLLGFVLIRLLGQGALFLVSANVINRWWVRRRGTVMGMAGVITAVLGLGAFPLMLDRLIPAVGWRTAYTLLGIMVIALMVPLSWAFLRERPEDHGLHPDGAPPRRTSAGPDTPPIEDNWLSRDALRTSAFWVFALSVASISMLTTGLMFHIVSIFQDSGLSASAAAAVYAPIAVTAAAFTFTGGVLMDRIATRIIMGTALGLQVIALLMARGLGGPVAVALYGITLGATQGLSRSVSSVVWAKYFGRTHLGSIAGSAQTASVIGAALGPPVLGIGRDMLGSYDLPLVLCTSLPLVLLAALFRVRPPKRTQAPTT